ncbi:MAG: hypothetical protein JNG84_02095, partial [Archangium sp.]|nr:hypothetical protein [Archangium sp.]
NPTVLTNPTRQSTLSLFSTCTTATVAMTGTYYELQRLNTSGASTTTGFGTAFTNLGRLTFDYVP